MRALIDRAAAGDVAALKLALERVYAAPRQAHEAVEIEGLAGMPRPMPSRPQRCARRSRAGRSRPMWPRRS